MSSIKSRLGKLAFSHYKRIRTPSLEEDTYESWSEATKAYIYIYSEQIKSRLSTRPERSNEKLIRNSPDFGREEKGDFFLLHRRRKSFGEILPFLFPREKRRGRNKRRGVSRNSLLGSLLFPFPSLDENMLAINAVVKGFFEEVVKN